MNKIKNLTYSYFDSVKRGDLNTVKNYIESSDICVNQTNLFKFTGLHYAVIYDHEELVDLFIENGADINKSNIKGMTAIHFAAHNGHLKLFKKLLKLGSNPFLKNEDNKMPYEIAEKHEDFTEYIKVNSMYSQQETTFFQPSQETKVNFSKMGLGNDLVLCSGIGCQKIGMLNHYIGDTSVRSLFQEANEILGYDIVQTIQKGPSKNLQKVHVSQPAIFLTNLSSILFESNNNPQKIENVGHISGFSIGELTSLVIAGVINWKLALHLIKIVMLEIEKLSISKKTRMCLVSGLDDEPLKEICEKTNTSIVNYLSKKTRIVSGTDENIYDFKKRIAECEPKVFKMLPINLPFHSIDSKIIVSKLESTLEKIKIKRPTIPIYSNILAKRLEKADDIRYVISKMIIEPVRFEGLFDFFDQEKLIEKFDNIYELPPSSYLKLLMKSINRKALKKMTNIHS